MQDKMCDILVREHTFLTCWVCPDWNFDDIDDVVDFLFSFAITYYASISIYCRPLRHAAVV